MTIHLPRAALFLALALASSGLHAQEAAARTYTPQDFARYAPRNAAEMLRQVPGFVIREAVQERGLGQATGNVLINGQRVSGKSNDALDELARIPAANVVRIEIVDGASLDIPGLSGQVANVVARAGGIRGQWSWRPEIRRYYTDPVLTRGDVSVSGARGALDYTVGLENNGGHSGAGGGTTIYNADGSFREYRDDAWTGEFDAPRVSTRLGWKGEEGKVANLNASVQRIFYDFEENGLRTGPGLPDRLREVRVGERGHNAELGGDYEFALAGGRLKLIGLARTSHSPGEQTVLTRRVDGAAPDTGLRFARVGDEDERIARGEYRWKRGVTDWQVSAEGAFNRLDSVSELAVLDPNGAFVLVPLPGGTATVEEDRYEVMGSLGRPLGSTLTMQLAAGGEYSHLQQVGGGGLSREFVRPKGSLSLAWKPRPGLDVNAKLQRRVGQLEFQDFLATVNLNDDRENAGNPDLVPQQSWELDVEATRALGAWGSTTLRVYAHRIDDIVDTIPIGDSGESPGNIDRATREGLEWKSTLNFDPLGWRGARLDARFQWEDSNVQDPLTGEDRRISRSLIRFAHLRLRHDVAGTPWAWGGEAVHEFRARDVRLTEIGRQWEGPYWGSVFIEHKNVYGLTLRATVANLFDARSMWDRTVYVDRRTGPVAFREDRDRRIGPILSFSVSGKF